MRMLAAIRGARVASLRTTVFRAPAFGTVQIRRVSLSQGSSAPPWRPPTLLDEWVQKEARPISLKQLTFFGRTLTKDRLLSSANYVRQELPVRIAHRLRDMQTLPYVVVSNKHISHVYERYYSAFETFRRVPEIKTLSENDEFCNVVSRMLEEHLTVIPSLAMGVLECQTYMKPEETDLFVNRLLRARISRRVIAEQHLALTESLRNGGSMTPGDGSQDAEGDFVGEVFLKCNAKDVVEKCAAVITSIARDAYGPDAKLPEIHVHGHLGATFPYILSHLEYIIGELLRNSMQATVERFAGRDETPPPIEVLICEAPQFVIFRISDQGGGVPTELLPSLWSFSRGPQQRDAQIEALSQVPKMEATMQELGREPEVRVQAGKLSEGTSDSRDTSLTTLASRPPDLRLGIGLPMSRVYAEYWAGSLSLQNLTGHGCDVFLQISKLGNKNEQLTTRASMDAV